MAEKRDFYEVLGVSKSATKDEIKSAWRKLAKTYHPDNKETGDEIKFKEIQEAYDILYDDQKRAAYDQFGHAAFDQNAGGGAGGFGGFGGGINGNFEDIDLGDIFGSIFGGGRRRSSQSTGPRRGNDTVMRVKISFMDAINGRKIKVNVTYDQPCASCRGSGAKTPNDVETCPRCRGTGHVRGRQQTIFGTVETQQVCPECGGKGKKIKEFCPDCGGKGYKKTKTEIDVNIPAGINTGQQLRIQGKGERGVNGGLNGDLYLEIVVDNHQYFKRQGNDIHVEIPVSMVDAALGVTLTVPTVYGDIEVKVPEGTQPGQILKVRGKGVKDLRTGIQGDQYITLNVETPTKLTKEQRELLSKFASLGSKGESIFDKFKNKFKK